VQQRDKFNSFGAEPTISDVWKISIEISDRLEIVERQQTEHMNAFPVNDLKKPDYDGHRLSHLKLKKSEEIIDSYKQEATKKIVGGIAVFLLGLFTTGIVQKVVELLK
jgi:hypothetical protein